MSIENKTISAIFEPFSPTVEERSATWFNGNGYMPLHEIAITFEKGDWHFDYQYESKESEYNKQNRGFKFAGGSYNAHTVRMNVSGRPVKTLPAIEITFRDAFHTLFYRGSGVKIKCADSVMKQKIAAIPELKRLSRLVQNDADFNPEIRGYEDLGEYILAINFQTAAIPFTETECLLGLVLGIIETTD